MSRARLLRRLERLMAEVEALESVIDTRGLEVLSDAELEALERELDPGSACVHHGTGDFISGCDCLDRARALGPGGRSEVHYLAQRLHRGEQAVAGSHPRTARPVPDLPVVSLEREVASSAEEPPEPAGVQEGPAEERRERRVLRSSDLPESRAGERARLFELDTVRLAEPGDVPGSGFGRWFPPRRRRRRSRRL